MLVRRFYEEAINQGNLSLMDELFAPNYQHLVLCPQWSSKPSDK